MNKFKMHITTNQVELINEWIKSRGGVLVWNSISLSNPGAQLLTPYLDSEGKVREQKPAYYTSNTPKHVKSAEEVAVIIPKVFKRFHVAVRPGAQGFSLKVTDGGTRRIHSYLEKAGEGSWYEFDYCNYDNCIIYQKEREMPLSEYGENKKPEGSNEQ